MLFRKCCRKYVLRSDSVTWIKSVSDLSNHLQHPRALRPMTESYLAAIPWRVIDLTKDDRENNQDKTKPAERLQISLELRTMEVVVTTGAIRHAKLPPNRHHQPTNIQLFTVRMTSLSPNQQWESTDGKLLTRRAFQQHSLLSVLWSVNARWKKCKWNEKSAQRDANTARWL